MYVLKMNIINLLLCYASSTVDTTKKKLLVAIFVSVASFLGLLAFVICFILGRRRRVRGKHFLRCFINLLIVHPSYILIFVCCLKIL